MQRQHFFSRAATVALFLIAVSVPALRADEPPYEPPSARMGWPPGMTASRTLPAKVGRPPAVVVTGHDTPTTAPETRVISGSAAEDQESVWAAFMTWLREQALRAASR